MRNTSVAILTDGLFNRGGVERIILSQAKHFNADIYVAFYNPETTYKEFKKLKIKKIIKNRLPWRFSTLQTWHVFSKLKLKKKYDCYILHGTGALNVANKLKPNIWYCHSPSRYLYDLYKEEYKKINPMLKLSYTVVTSIQRIIDQKNVKSVDKILVNSENVKQRVKKYYNRTSQVVYPFVNLKKFKWLKQRDYYISTGRLDSIKRIHLIIKAFKKMPDKKLIIASDGPERENLVKQAGDMKNITFLGYVSEKKLHDLYGKCIATLYLSYKEDFGIVPIESMSAGKPCIATNDGGFKETIIHKKTGYLVNNPENVDEVIKAVKWMTKKISIKMRKDCEKRAKLFSEKKFVNNMKKEINKLLSKTF